MSTKLSGRPEAGEYLPYYDKYISLVAGDDIVAQLEGQLSDTLALLRGVSDEQAESRYAPGKWSLKEVVGHVLDYERIFSSRALAFARAGAVAMPGFDQEELMAGAPFGAYGLGELASEFEHARHANVSFFRHLCDDAWTRRGVANNAEVSVRALAYIMAGHELHHLRVIRERYL
jgi:uncharacterized damage-inducible protein DinB